MQSARLFYWLPVFTMLALSGCADSDNDTPGANPVEPQPTGTIEIIHASQDAPDVDVRIANLLVASGVDFKEARTIPYEVGDYSIEVEGNIPGGDATVIPAAGQPAPTLTVAENQRLTVVAAGDVANIGPIVLTDTPPAVADDQVRLRVLHAASNAPAVEVYVTAPGDPLGMPLGSSRSERISARWRWPRARTRCALQCRGRRRPSCSTPARSICPAAPT